MLTASLSWIRIMPSESDDLRKTGTEYGSWILRCCRLLGVSSVQCSSVNAHIASSLGRHCSISVWF